MRFLYRWAPLHLENIYRTVPPKHRLPIAAANPARSAGCFRPQDGWSIPMMDLILVALGLAFFVLSVGYAYACERL